MGCRAAVLALVTNCWLLSTEYSLSPALAPPYWPKVQYFTEYYAVGRLQGQSFSLNLLFKF